MSSGNCEEYTITYYAQNDFPGNTADGTPTAGNVGAIAAGSYNLHLGTWVWIEGIGSRRIADRGHLGDRQVDVLVQTHREAMNLGTHQRTVCIE